jgi:sugar diacid utilization regulator
MGLSASMFAMYDEEQILAMAAERIPLMCPCAVEGTYLVRDHRLQPRQGNGATEDNNFVLAQLNDLRGGSGPVRLVGRAWSWAFALRGLAGLCGYLVVGAAVEPASDLRDQLQGLAMVAGAAIAAAQMYRRTTGDASTIAGLSTQIDATTDMARRGRVSEILAHSAAADGGEQGIAQALAELTGRSVAVEDELGHLRASAGPEPPRPHTPPSSDRLAWRASQAEHGESTLRDGDMLLAVVAPHGEVLGAVALRDPQGTASEYEVFALEQAAMVLAIEQFHRRRRLDVQMTRQRDFVDDLLGGLDDEAASARGAALGQDMSQPRRAVLIRWQDALPDPLALAVASAATTMQMGTLISRREGMVMVLATEASNPDGDRWLSLHRRLAGALQTASGAIGVGGMARTPGQLARSFEEAGHALSIRAGSRSPFGVTTFEELGIYRILARGESRHDVEQFVTEWLGALIDYDTAHNTDMVNTVAAYCESGGNYDRTAQALTIHRSTLRYRLQRIRELSGHPLTNVEVRFNMQVATRALRLLRGFS